jgi:hypothetical protein
MALKYIMKAYFLLRFCVRGIKLGDYSFDDWRAPRRIDANMTLSFSERPRTPRETA